MSSKAARMAAWCSLELSDRKHCSSCSSPLLDTICFSTTISAIDRRKSNLGSSDCFTTAKLPLTASGAHGIGFLVSLSVSSSPLHHPLSSSSVEDRVLRCLGHRPREENIGTSRRFPWDRCAEEGSSELLTSTSAKPQQGTTLQNFATFHRPCAYAGPPRMEASTTGRSTAAERRRPGTQQHPREARSGR